MTVKYPTQCAACVHFRGAATNQALACDAFPGGIPNNIVYFGEDHRKPRRGDHGVTFEQKPGEQAAKDFEAWRSVHAPEEEPDGNSQAGSQSGSDAP